MSNSETPPVGTIGWHDLTVNDADAEKVRDFYSKVAGWTATPLSMGGYNDFIMTGAGSPEPVAGVCHARGPNVDLPRQWLMYIIVEDVDRSAEQCVELGGEILTGPRGLSGGRFCVIRDPAGAVCALYQPAAPAA